MIGVEELTTQQLLWHIFSTKLFIASIKGNTKHENAFIKENKSFIISSLEISFNFIYREYIFNLLFEFIPGIYVFYLFLFLLALYKITNLNKETLSEIHDTIKKNIIQELNKIKYVRAENNSNKCSCYQYILLVREIIKVAPEQLSTYSQALLFCIESLLPAYQIELKDTNSASHGNYPPEEVKKVDRQRYPHYPIDFNLPKDPSPDEWEIHSCLMTCITTIGENLSYLKTMRSQYISNICKLFKMDYTYNMLSRLIKLFLSWCTSQEPVLSPQELETVFECFSDIRHHSDQPHTCCLFNDYAEIILTLWKKHVYLFSFLSFLEFSHDLIDQSYTRDIEGR